MDAPVGAAAGAGAPLYGDGWFSINRRTLLAGLSALAGPLGAAVPPISRLWWRGTARVTAGGRTLDLTVETDLKLPLLEVRSVSYITAEGPATARTLLLEPGGVWLERSGSRTALPAELGNHERQQYALYA